MNGFTIPQGDRRPSRLMHLTEQIAGRSRPFDLTHATSVVFVFRSGGTRRSGAATVVNTAAGLVRYDWQAGDTDVVGDYACSFLVTIDGLEQTVPSGGVGTFTITARL